MISAALATLALAGCATTQQQAAWLRLNHSRLRASELSVRVSSPGSVAAVEQVAGIAGGGRFAVVVRVRNQGSRTLSDLPISVGTVNAAGKRTYLNAAPGLDFFRTHVPLVPAHGGLTWVYTTRERVAAGAHLFALVGSRSRHAGHPMPQIQVLRRRGPGIHGGTVRLTVINHSSIPQYQLPVYAIVRRGRRYVAAGEGTIGDLTGGGSRGLRVQLVGRPGGRIQLEAPPTIFE